MVRGGDRQLVLGGEVVEERALGDAGGCAEVVDGRGVQTALADDAQGCVEQPRACGPPGCARRHDRNIPTSWYVVQGTLTPRIKR